MHKTNLDGKFGQWPMKKNRFGHPLIIGHRGFRAKYPENTMAGFRAAMDAGADMIELDVRLTRDHHLVVIHDAFLDRTTSGKGRVRDFSLSELKNLDAGAWFSPKFVNERLPVLDDVLDLVRDRVWLNIEVKVSPEDDGENDACAEQVTQSIQKKDAEGFCIVSSFHWDVLQRIRNRQEDLHLGVLTYKDKTGFLNVCKQLNAMAWHPHYRYFNTHEVGRAKNAGLKILPYTVNATTDMEHVLALGADGFFTDDPILGKTVSNGRHHLPS